MLDQLKMKVYNANLDLVKNGLVIYTWGNVSAIDRDKELIAIKPSGVKYDKMTINDIVILDCDGNLVEGEWTPSVDLATHLYLYKVFKNIGGIAHTHSTYATAFAQSQREIVAYGTTHADYFYGNIPCTRLLDENEVKDKYEYNTGKVIAETFNNIDTNKVPACLVGGHGLFSWGKNADEAVFNATVAERCAKIAYLTETINPDVSRASQYLLDKHYQRKHGEKATYGQRGSK